jgi:RNA polymerase sigma-70 factor, ECF subfamily
MDDQVLIEGLKRKDENAFSELVNYYQGKVLNTCFGLLQNLEDARDIAQEVFIEIYCSIHSFKSNSKLGTWIYRIAVNKSLDFIAMKRRKKRFSQFQVIIGLNPGKSEEIVITDNSNPHTDLEKAERLKYLTNAINSLPANQKTAFTLNKYELMSYEEIAEIMDLSFSAVQSLIHRAKLNLQKKLYKYFSEKIT